jgi:hypothetical protein
VASPSQSTNEKTWVQLVDLIRTPIVDRLLEVQSSGKYKKRKIDTMDQVLTTSNKQSPKKAKQTDK